MNSNAPFAIVEVTFTLSTTVLEKSAVGALHL